MSYFGKKWQKDPTWGDFAQLVLLWGYLFIPAIICFRRVWWALLLSMVGYSIVIYLAYRHVKLHKIVQTAKTSDNNFVG